MKYQLTHFGIKRFRSMKNVELDIINGHAVIICGENNIGKTNVLEAMDIFFNHNSLEALFDPDRDIPHHIQFGSGGQQQNTELSANFLNENKEQLIVTVIFKKDESIEYKVKQGKNATINAESTFKSIINTFKFFYVKSNNVDIPSLVSEMFVTDGLVKLDNKRERQQKPLKILKQFQEQAQIALNDIQKELNQHLQELNILSNSNSSIKITFAEFDKLRDVVSRMTDVTIDDGNDHSISSKGSGAQRTALLTLMNYIASNATKEVIWGLDEPEVFLQPKAQKQLYKAIKKMAREKRQTVVMTTHSQHFIDLNNLDYTHLFVCSINEKIYTRRKGKVFYEKNTTPHTFSSDSAKAKAIRDHLGIEKNDGWNLLPYNVIVEGETDKKYLEAIISNTQLVAPNIIWSGSASKISAKIEFYNNLAEDLDYKPKLNNHLLK